MVSGEGRQNVLPAVRRNFGRGEEKDAADGRLDENSAAMAAGGVCCRQFGETLAKVERKMQRSQVG